MERGDRQPRVVMFVMNDLVNDPRVQREARSAVRAGFRVRVVALQSDRCRVEREMVDGYEVLHVRVPRFRVTDALFKLVWWPLSLGWMVSKMGLVLKEGVNLAFGLPSGPEAPGHVSEPPSRLRRLKWGLMRGIGLLLFPLRVFRPFLSRVDVPPKTCPPPQNASNGLVEKLGRGVSETGFIEETLRITLAMLRAVRDERAEVYHGNDLPTLPVTAWAARRAGGKALYDSHEVWVGMDPQTTPFFQAVSRWIENHFIRRIDAVVTVNDFIAEELRRRYAIPLPSVVMNCPEPTLARPVAPDRSLRARLGLPSGTPLMLYQGLYMPGRGLEALIESSRYLSQGVLVLRGYGANERDLRQRAAALGSPGRVFFVDPVPMGDLIQAASEADVGVVPYAPCTPGNYYASPNKLFEYMMAGLAVAVSNLPFLEKIVRDHDLGIVFDPADPRHIAEQLNALVGNPARLRACRENATRVARARYHWGHEGGKLIQLYRTLTEQHSGQSPRTDTSMQQNASVVV